MPFTVIQAIGYSHMCPVLSAPIVHRTVYGGLSLCVCPAGDFNVSLLELGTVPQLNIPGDGQESILDDAFCLG